MYCCPGSARAKFLVLSHTTSVIVLLKVVESDPSKLVVASRFGRNATPSGVTIVSGTDTSTQATAPPLSSPAEEMDRSSSSRLATVVSSHSPYWCGVYPSEKIPVTVPVSDRQMPCRSSITDQRVGAPASSRWVIDSRSAGSSTATRRDSAVQANSRRCTSPIGMAPG